MRRQEGKHKEQLKEWKERVTECRNSRETVQAWCKEQGIGMTTYYRWEKEVLAEEERQEQQAAEERGRGGKFVAVPAQVEQRWQAETNPALSAKVRKGGVEVEIYVGAEVETIELLLRVLSDAE